MGSLPRRGRCRLGRAGCAHRRSNRADAVAHRDRAARACWPAPAGHSRRCRPSGQPGVCGTRRGGRPRRARRRRSRARRADRRRRRGRGGGGRA
ncbi:MAG: hypothetical protein F4134_13750 [Acidimicrobiaceae bacterium]|nr:hypothetical protein [Acidimicrobiaceae bacterium]MYK76957.1 hypothetical protein [Acidimicrobiaceae bacterium]